MPTELQIQDIADTDIDDSEEALVPSLELALVEDLHGDDGGVLDGSFGGTELATKHRHTTACFLTCQSSHSSRGSAFS